VESEQGSKTPEVENKTIKQPYPEYIKTLRKTMPEQFPDTPEGKLRIQMEASLRLLEEIGWLH